MRDERTTRLEAWGKDFEWISEGSVREVELFRFHTVSCSAIRAVFARHDFRCCTVVYLTVGKQRPMRKCAESGAKQRKGYRERQREEQMHRR